jgi:hypothetical protein
MTSQAYEYFRSEGHALAGGPGDYGLRAGLYHRMYQDSGKRNVFLLIAAHGTLWAAGYFKKGVLGAWLLSLPYLFTPKARAAKLRAAAQFADKFRDINRLVCAESYAIYYYTKHYGGTGFIRGVVGNALCDLLCECHAANDFGIAQREKLFRAFCDWEQETVVAPLVTQAFQEIDWPVIRSLALRTNVAVSYLGKSFKVQFTNFTSQDERLVQGLRLCRRAEEVGLEYTEQCLRHYAIKPVPDTAAIPCARPGTAPRSRLAPDATARYC